MNNTVVSQYTFKYLVECSSVPISPLIPSFLLCSLASSSFAFGIEESQTERLESNRIGLAYREAATCFANEMPSGESRPPMMKCLLDVVIQ